MFAYSLRDKTHAGEIRRSAFRSRIIFPNVSMCCTYSAQFRDERQRPGGREAATPERNHRCFPQQCTAQKHRQRKRPPAPCAGGGAQHPLGERIDDARSG